MKICTQMTKTSKRVVNFMIGERTWGICNNNNNLYTESGHTLQCSFSAASKQNFASTHVKALAEIYMMNSFAPLGILCTAWNPK